MPLQLSNRPLGRFVRNLIVMGLICQACTGVASAADAVQHSMFAGSLIQPGDDEGDILRRFEVQLLTTNQTCFFHVIDDARLGCPWPDSFGRTGPTAGTDTVQPHLVYDYDGHAYLIGLPPLIVTLPADLAPGCDMGTSWLADDSHRTTLRQRRPCLDRGSSRAAR